MSDPRIHQAVEHLKAGQLIVLPTETVYGLAADAQNELAVRQIFALKGRPSNHPLIVHLPDVKTVRAWVSEFPPAAQQLADAFWPGPLTLILKRSALPSDVVTGNQDTVGVRIPAHPLALELLRAFGGGLAAPSANRFGGVSPTTAQHVRDDLGEQTPFLLDGGPCQVGVESTIVDLSRATPLLLRPGGIAQEELERVLKQPVPLESKPQIRASGTLESHYAPRAGVLLLPREKLAETAERFLNEGRKVAALVEPSCVLPDGIIRFHLPEGAQARAQRLYSLLREMDERNVDVILTSLPPETGLDAAVCDRLRRAAAPRQPHQ